MQTRTDFEQAAQKIADSFVASKGEMSINKLATDIAKTAGLNPEGIRTMVRIANVATFQKLFQTKTGEDRMIEFEVGDPEIVVNNLFADAKGVIKQASVEEYDRRKDYYGDFPSNEKIAEYPVKKLEETKHPTSSRYAKYIIKEAQERVRQDKNQLEYRWLESMEKAAQLLRLVSEDKVSEMSAYETDALSKFGSEVLPELKILHFMVQKERNGFLYDHEKVASIIETNISLDKQRFRNVHSYVKIASETRRDLADLHRKQEFLAVELEKVPK